MGTLTVRKSKGSPGVIIRGKAKIKEPPKPPPPKVAPTIEDIVELDVYVPPVHGVCYVCERRIKPEEVLVQGVGLTRHETCAPGTKKWLDSPIGQKSKYRQLFIDNLNKKGEVDG